MQEKEKIKNWILEKCNLKDWNHYSIEIKTLNDDYENSNLREFEIKIKRQDANLSMTQFKTIKITTCFIDLLQELIPKLKMYNCYIKLNSSGLYNLNVYSFYNDILKWREHVEKVFEKHDKKEREYRAILKMDKKHEELQNKARQKGLLSEVA